MLLSLTGCEKEEPQPPPPSDFMQVKEAWIGDTNLKSTDLTTGVPVDKPVVISFSNILDTTTVMNNLTFRDEDSADVSFNLAYLDNFSTVSLIPEDSLDFFTQYKVSVKKGLKGSEGSSFPGLSYAFQTRQGVLEVTSVMVNEKNLDVSGRLTGIDTDVQIDVVFNHPLDTSSVRNKVKLVKPGHTVQGYIEFPDNNQTLRFTSTDKLKSLSRYYFNLLGDIVSSEGFVFEGGTWDFYTKLVSVYQFPVISEEELLTKVQEQTFRYFWDFGHPVSGLARERNTSGETVTSGGSGFGLMAIIVGIERGFITRQEGISRFQKIFDFLQNADRFHGVWSHWLNGSTGEVIPFSTKDDGGDLVETSYLAAGMLTVRQYLDSNDPVEADLITQINDLWETIEWSWHTQGGQDVLYWHWSPNYGWEKDHQIRGWNEALITYIMAASSPTYGIEATVYHNGWAKNGDIVNGNAYYDITLPLGRPYGGPLFFEHYTFLGIDPRNLSDQYADYWQQAVNHTLINWAYCVENPLNYVGYSEHIWGLTASDNHEGYSAHSPTNDKGVITPTAALSSLPYTPDRSMDAMEHFYYFLGDELWGEYGFHDAFNPTEGWYAGSFLAIDQGPIVIMIENHRTALVWDLLMSAPEVQQGLDKLGFTY